jgi:hypothetical protein
MSLLPIVFFQDVNVLVKNHASEIKKPFPISCIFISSVLSDTRPQRRPGDGPHLGAVRVSAYSETLFASGPFLRSGPKARGHRKWMLNKTGRTTKNPRPSGYGTFALQRDQSLFARTSNFVTLASRQIGPHQSTPSNGQESGLTREDCYEYLIFMNTFL